MKLIAQAKNRLSWFLGRSFLGGVLVVILPFLQRLLYLNGLFYGRDFSELIGARGYFYHQLRHGKLVLWDAVQATGIPFPTYFFDLFNPLSLIYTFLLKDGYLRSNPAQWMLTIHCSLGALGAYLLGMSLKLGRTAAVVMGVIMGCCGVVVIKSVEPMMVHTFAWAPFIFLFLHRARLRGSKLDGLWAGVFTGLCFMGGHPQIFYYIAVAILLHAIYGLIVDTHESGSRAAWILALRIYLPLSVSFLLTCAPQFSGQLASAIWGPEEVITSFSTRRLLIHSQTGSADLSMLFSFLFPTLQGGQGEYFFYVGIMPLVLAWVAALGFKPRSEAGFWKVLVIVFVILMMGGNLGIHKILVYVLPGFKYFRLPSRYSFVVHLGLLVLAGFGVARLLAVKESRELSGFTRGLAVIMGGLFLMMIALIAVGHLGIIKNPDDLSQVLQAMTGLLLFLAAAWFVFWRLREGERGDRIRFFIVAAVVLDLAFYYPSVGLNFNIVKSEREYGPDPSEVTVPMDALARDLGHVCAEGPSRVLIGIYGVREPWVRDISQSAFYRYRVRSFYPNDGYPERLFPLGFWQLVWPENLMQMPRAINLLGVKFLENGRPEMSAKRSRWDLLGFSQAAIRLNPEEKISQLTLEIRADGFEGKDPGMVVAEIGLVEGRRLKGSWKVTLEQLLKKEPLEIPLNEPLIATEMLMASANPNGKVRIEKVLINGKPVSDTLETTPVRQFLVRNEHSQSLAFFVSRAAVFKNESPYLEALFSEDPSRCVLFRETPPGYQTPSQMTTYPGGEVKIIYWRDEEVRLQVNAQSPGYLVMTQSAYPGWTARVDGRKISISKAYGFLTTLPIPSGSHQVRFTYQEPWVVAGLVISPLWIIGLVLWPFWLRRKKSKR